MFLSQKHKPFWGGPAFLLFFFFMKASIGSSALSMFRNIWSKSSSSLYLASGLSASCRASANCCDWCSICFNLSMFNATVSFTGATGQTFIKETSDFTLVSVQREIINYLPMSCMKWSDNWWHTVFGLTILHACMCVHVLNFNLVKSYWFVLGAFMLYLTCLSLGERHQLKWRKKLLLLFNHKEKQFQKVCAASNRGSIWPIPPFPTTPIWPREF